MPPALNNKFDALPPAEGLVSILYTLFSFIADDKAK
jgi:hypothetical protein